MILHIHSYHSIFTDLSFDIFHELGIPGTHIILKNKEILKEKQSPVQYCPIHSKDYYSLIKQELGKYKLILFHGLLDENLTCLKEILKHNKTRPPIAWVIYGAEIENSFLIPSAFLGRFTKFYYYYLLPYRIFIPLYRLLNKANGVSLRKCLKNTNYYAHFMPEEIDFVAEQIRIKRPMLWHSYIALDHFIEDSIRDKRAKTNGDILIGNSSSFTSNHLEAFHKLKGLDTGKRKIIVPLNYGNKTYRKFILKKGVKYFDDRFVPLTEFMEKELYHNLLTECSVMILNQYKQQGLGNIIAAAWMGIRIYVNEFTSTYRYFKRIGLHIFSIESDMTQQNDEIFTSLNEQQIQHNRAVLSEHFSREAVSRNTYNDFKQFM